MIKYPHLKEQPSTRQVVDTFRGINYNVRIGAGEFSAMKNMTADNYPLLSPRHQRAVSADIPKTYGTLQAAIHTGRRGIMYVQGNRLFRLGNLGPLQMELNDKPKQFVFMGTYMIILPDMKYVNLEMSGDYGNIGHRLEVVSGELTIELCNSEGEAYDATPRSVAPSPATNGMLWLDNSLGTQAVLKQYDANSASWVVVQNTYVSISNLPEGTDGEFFSKGDGITISGLASGAGHLNGNAVIHKCSAGRIVITGMLANTVKHSCTTAKPVVIERKIPEMDFVVEAGNRLWGCRYGLSEDGLSTINELYASKLGDFRNWNCFEGISTDSWVASVGSRGPFTGAANLGGYPVFYKGDIRYKIWPSANGAHQVTSVDCQGVQEGCSGSVATVPGGVIYKTEKGFAFDDGSMPVNIGQCFAGMRFLNASADASQEQYFVSMEDEQQQWHFYVYDIKRKLWHRQDEFHASSICSMAGMVYATEAGANRIWIMNPRSSWNGGLEDQVSWFAVTGDLGLEIPEQKYISRLTLRLSLDPGATLEVYAQYDRENTWVRLGQVYGTDLRSFSLPVRPRRCDQLRLKLQGTGMCKIYSITKTLEKGSELT